MHARHYSLLIFGLMLCVSTRAIRQKETSKCSKWAESTLWLKQYSYGWGTKWRLRIYYASPTKRTGSLTHLFYTLPWDENRSSGTLARFSTLTPQLRCHAIKPSVHRTELLWTSLNPNWKWRPRAVVKLRFCSISYLRTNTGREHGYVYHWHNIHTLQSLILTFFSQGNTGSSARKTRSPSRRLRSPRTPLPRPKIPHRDHLLPRKPVRKTHRHPVSAQELELRRPAHLVGSWRYRPGGLGYHQSVASLSAQEVFDPPRPHILASRALERGEDDQSRL
jgi:hypothetical protein